MDFPKVVRKECEQICGSLQLKMLCLKVSEALLHLNMWITRDLQVTCWCNFAFSRKSEYLNKRKCYLIIHQHHQTDILIMEQRQLTVFYSCTSHNFSSSLLNTFCSTSMPGDEFKQVWNIRWGQDNFIGCNCVCLLRRFLKKLNILLGLL